MQVFPCGHRQNGGTVCSECSRARVPSKSPKWMDSDVLLEAREVLLKCMRGEVKRDCADVQRRAALDVLGGALEALSDEALLAEVKRRAG